MKSKELWIRRDGYDWDGYPKYFVMEKQPAKPYLKEYLHVREISPKFDAIFLELLKALKEFRSEIEANYIGTGANDPEGSMEKALIALSEQAYKVIVKAEGIEK